MGFLLTVRKAIPGQLFPLKEILQLGRILYPHPALSKKLSTIRHMTNNCTNGQPIPVDQKDSLSSCRDVTLDIAV